MNNSTKPTYDWRHFIQISFQGPPWTKELDGGDSECPGWWRLTHHIFRLFIHRICQRGCDASEWSRDKYAACAVKIEPRMRLHVTAADSTSFHEMKIQTII